MIDCHIHFAESLLTERLNHIVDNYNLEAIALQCIPKGGKVPVELDALRYQAQCKVPVFIFGGIDRTIFSYDKDKMAYALYSEIIRLMDMKCTGIKMLEGKPDVRKQHAIPDFDHDIWEPYWALAEQIQVPIVFHVNDPEEFWDSEKVSEYAKKVGWFYDDSFVKHEEQYEQVLHVLERHPKLRILFPHFFFMSHRLECLGAILDRFVNVRIDITPGIELYYQLSNNKKEAKQFFIKYQNRICYGTDIGARSVIHTENIPLSIEESDARIQLIRTFLESDDEYILAADGYYVREKKPKLMHGLGLQKEILNNIYRDNFLKFIRKGVL